jgi:hypothetical protein
VRPPPSFINTRAQRVRSDLLHHRHQLTPNPHSQPSTAARSSKPVPFSALQPPMSINHPSVLEPRINMSHHGL